MLLLLHFPGGQDITALENEYLRFIRGQTEELQRSRNQIFSFGRTRLSILQIFFKKKSKKGYYLKRHSLDKVSVQFSSVQSLSRVRLCDPMNRSMPGLLSITNSQSSLKLMSIESVMPSSHFILCHPLLLLPPNPPSFRVFPNESALRMRWPNYWSSSFSISPSNDHRGLISFRMDWLDLLQSKGLSRVFSNITVQI